MNETWTNAQIVSFGIVPKIPKFFSKSNSKAGANKNIFIFTETATLTLIS